MSDDANYSHSYGGPPAGKSRPMAKKKKRPAKKKSPKSLKQVFGS